MLALFFFHCFVHAPSHDKSKMQINHFLSHTIQNEAKLRLYGYYKQATVGDMVEKKPPLLSFAGIAKWEVRVLL